MDTPSRIQLLGCSVAESSATPITLQSVWTCSLVFVSGAHCTTTTTSLLGGLFSTFNMDDDNSLLFVIGIGKELYKLLLSCVVIATGYPSARSSTTICLAGCMGL